MANDEPLFLNDKATATRLGLKPELAEAVFTVLEKRGFPRPDPLFEEKRYWPAVRPFLDRRQGLLPDGSGGDGPLNPDGKENWG